MSLETPNWGLPYPELPDPPNVPSDLAALVTRLDDVLQQIQDQVFLPKKANGAVAVPTSAGALSIVCGFQPQRVRIKTVYDFGTDPISTSSSEAFQWNEGVAGYDPDGNITQWLQALDTEDVTVGSHQRVIYGSVAGLVIGTATPVGRAALSSFDPNGFTINVLSAAPGSGYEYWWEADQ